MTPSWFELPNSWQQLQVTKLSNDFQAVTSLHKLTAYEHGENQVVVRIMYAGVNASDVNFSAGKYHGSKETAEKALPFAAGLEGVGVVVKAGSKAKIPVGSAVGIMESGKS